MNYIVNIGIFHNYLQYSGTWFEYANYFAIFQLFGKCVTATYTLEPDNGYGKYELKINIVNRAISTL